MNSHGKRGVPIAAVALAAAFACCAALSQGAGDRWPAFEYLITNVDLSAGQSDGVAYARMEMDIRSIHSYSRNVQFVVFGLLLKVDDADGTTTVPMNRHAARSEEERFGLPLSARIDEAVVAHWFDEALPGRKSVDYEVTVPTNARVMGATQRSREVKSIDGTVSSPTVTVSFRTIRVGHSARDALPLLGNPLLPASMREDLARRASRLDGRKYRYLDDGGTWRVVDGLGDALPAARPEDQAAPGVLKDAGPAANEGGIRARNGSTGVIYVGVAGGGHREWKKVGPGDEVFFALDSGLYALTRWNRGYVTETVLLAPGRRYEY